MEFFYVFKINRIYHTDPKKRYVQTTIKTCFIFIRSRKGALFYIFTH